MKLFTRMRRLGKPVMGWALYDWANSAFATTVMAGFFPLFFKDYWSAGTDVNISTFQLALGNSLSGLIVAVLSPLLGAIADRASLKKRFLLVFAWLGVLMTAALFTVHSGEWQLAIFYYVIGVVGFSAANSFYDSLITTVADEKEVDFVSGLGYSLGYLGGGLLFLINVLMYLMPQSFGLPDAAYAVRAAFVTVALWWGLFSLFLLFWVEEDRSEVVPTTLSGAVMDGLRELVVTLRHIRRLKMTFLFLTGYFLYIDGIDTIIRMAVDYGRSLGFEAGDLITALLVVQFVGFPAAIIFARIGEAWDVKKALLAGVGVYMLITLLGIQMSGKTEFYVLAILVGLVQGGMQALSRSFYSRLIPKNKAAQFYGFYNMIGKSAVILGPLLMGAVGLLIKSLLLPEGAGEQEMREVSLLATRWGLAALLPLFLAGGYLLYRVDENQARRELEAG